jgi:hypothetical protein
VTGVLDFDEEPPPPQEEASPITIKINNKDINLKAELIMEIILKKTTFLQV